jgi:LAO/AO transport system kinase
MEAKEWALKIREGDRKAASKLITMIENKEKTARDVLKLLFHGTGTAVSLGITGPAGVGKSCLVSCLIAAFRKKGKTIGVIAVDPSSPFTGGAFLGDRVRMMSHIRDEGVYIRSMATRGYLGGLARSTLDTMRVLEAMGKQVVMVETVGTGQDEIEVAQIVQTCLLVLTPNMGDDIQAMKSGIMEVGNIIVLNKTDMPGKEKALLDLETALRFRLSGKEEWTIPIVCTAASTGEGIEELVNEIEKHQVYLRTGEGLSKFVFKRAEKEGAVLLKDEIERVIFHGLKGTGLRRKYLEKIASGEIDPYSAVEDVLRRFIKEEPIRPLNKRKASG